MLNASDCLKQCPDPQWPPSDNKCQPSPFPVRPQQLIHQLSEIHLQTLAEDKAISNSRPTASPHVRPKTLFQDPDRQKPLSRKQSYVHKFPQHPDTQAGHQAHQAQQADWMRTYGYGTKVTEKTPYPLRPGTAPVNSGECFTCCQPGHVGACSGVDCEALGFRTLQANEQLWRVICSRVLKEPRVTTNVQFLTIDNYGTTLQEIQGNGEGP